MRILSSQHEGTISKAEHALKRRYQIVELNVDTRRSTENEAKLPTAWRALEA